MMKSALSGMIILAAALISGCNGGHAGRSDDELAIAHAEGVRDGLREAIREQAAIEHGQLLACEALSGLPPGIQRLGGLDCAREWDPNAKSVAPSPPWGALALASVLLALAGLFSFWAWDGLRRQIAALALMAAPIRAAYLRDARDELNRIEMQQREALQTLQGLEKKKAQIKQEIVELEDAIEEKRESWDEIKTAQKQAVEAIQAAMKLAEQAERKKTSTADLAAQLAALGRTPRPD